MNDQKKKHEKDLVIKAVKVGDGDSAKEIEAAKLKSHGIIAKDKDGKIVTKVDGHAYGKPKVEEVIRKLLGREVKSETKETVPEAAEKVKAT